MMYSSSSSRCSNSHGSSNNMVGGPCSCGLYHCQNNSSFSMLFSMSGSHESTNHHHHHYQNHNMYSFGSPVDCTLSLGTPSTRAGHDHSDHRKLQHDHQQTQNRSRSGFCWDLLTPNANANNNKYSNNHTTTPVQHLTPAASSHKSSRGSSNSCGGESLLTRRCANCDTTSTPLWRNGPRGPKSLCNACGIRYKKEERRATAAAATNNVGSVVGMDHQYHQNMNMNMNNNNGSWVHQKMPSCGEFRFVEEDDNFLSWRLNVTDHSRNNYVHDFTR